MAARKLQQEMDRVFKRVGEGVQAFDSIYEKYEMSTNHSQKEKLEQDLKREIKKLQRLRDQIKTWMGSNDIKDKNLLTEQRKLIEQEMERFKACEKEMKTKAYSKEGLTSSRLDPREKEKRDTIDFIQSMLEELDRQMESLEAEQESLQGTMRKGKKDHGKSERISDIEHTLERHRWHQGKMETILRMLENNTLAAEMVNDLQDDIKYYVESNQEIDFAEDEEIYNELNLEDDEDFDPDSVHQPKEETSFLEDLAVDAAKEKEEKEEKSGANSSQTSSHTNSTPSVSNAALPASVRSVPPSRKASSSMSPSINHAGLSISNKPSIVSGNSPSIGVAASLPAAGTPPIKQSLPPGLSPLPPPPKPEQQPLQSTLAKPVISAPPATPWAEKLGGGLEHSKKDDEAVRTKPSSPSVSASSSPRLAVTPTPPPELSSSSISSQESSLSLASFVLPPGLQDLAHSFDAARNRIGSPPPIASISKLLESSYLSCPDSFIADRPRYYHPESPFPTPSFYPQEPLTGLDDPAIMAKMDVDTLFYIFYYRQGSYQQYLSAKELKNRSWRFHKRFLTWFQRHEEPKIINNEFEQGTYRYFDFEGLWLQRRKSNFKFEYQFLEDEV